MRTEGDEEYLSKHGWGICECHFTLSTLVFRECTSELLDQCVGAQKASIALWHAGTSWSEIWRTTEGHPTDSSRRLLQLGYHMITMTHALDFHDVQVEQEVSTTIQQNKLGGMDLSYLSAAKNIEQSKARITFIGVSEHHIKGH